MDLEALVCGGSGRVACETVIAGAPPGEAAEVVEDPDFPPESFQVPIGEEIEWVDLIAVYERDDSTKGNTNPKSQHANIGVDHRVSNSQRFSGNLKPKAPIIALPNKLQHSGYLGRSARRPANARIFPKKGRNAGVTDHEPGSPKVSCFGKVGSEKEKQRGMNQQRGGGRGFWASFFCCAGGDRASPAELVEKQRSPQSWSNTSSSASASAAPAAPEAPGIGAMNRFASGRRSASWGGDEDGHMAWSGPLDEDGFRIRRSVGSMEDPNHEADA
ncbi:hypothetical protein J5N97_012194 [Dioscorea zingiberensis]|uniref:Uncharacterized protein n=1 Tax=Dioscorea zingiberensis TaxID=325984 RepID=A0A9D5CR04_9LILI|nr:hypothetical protein J5N97_012194 [Dioscorea zingiberensis]